MGMHRNTWDCSRRFGGDEIDRNSFDIFSHITPEEMAGFKQADNQISVIYPWVQDGKIPPKSVLYKTRSKTARKLFYKF